MDFFTSNLFEAMIALSWLAMVVAMYSWVKNNDIADLAYRASHTEFLVASMFPALLVVVYYFALAFDPVVTLEFRSAIVRPAALAFAVFMCLFFLNGHLYKFIRWLRRLKK